MEGKYIIRRFALDDASEVQTVIHPRSMAGMLIEDFCASFTIEKILSQAESAHMHVAMSDVERILGTGSIAPY